MWVSPRAIINARYGQRRLSQHGPMSKAIIDSLLKQRVGKSIKKVQKRAIKFVLYSLRRVARVELPSLLAGPSKSWSLAVPRVISGGRSLKLTRGTTARSLTNIGVAMCTALHATKDWHCTDHVITSDDRWQMVGGAIRRLSSWPCLLIRYKN
jgi:hypothetical protein